MPAAKKPDEAAISILKALSELGGGPATCKEIAAKAGLDVKRVAGKMRGLANAGYVVRTEEGKYKLTDKGKELLKGG